MDKKLRDRYSRQTMLPVIGDEGQEKLLKSHAVIIGCGALGCQTANLLVRAGVGKIRIIDRDFIEYHNLQRQVLFDEDDVKARLPKAIAAEKHLSKVNSTIHIEGVVADVNSMNIEGLCSEADVIVDGLDNFETRLLINDVSLRNRIPWVYGGAIATNGMTMTVIPGETPCFRCISPAIPKSTITQTCESVGVIAGGPAIIASLQATEVIKILTGSKDINRNLILIDVWKDTFNQLQIAKRDNCPACGGNYEFLDNKFTLKTNSLCGQARAVQIVNGKLPNINLDKLVEHLKGVNNIEKNEYFLTFKVKDLEIIVFPDGRAIIKNTLDETEAIEVYQKYIAL